jgi:phage shock protein A
MTQLTPAGDTPTLEQVRDKIEARYARALGEAELTSNSVEARMIEVERAALDVEGAARLESIRESLGLPGAQPTPAVGAGGSDGRSVAKPTEESPAEGATS